MNLQKASHQWASRPADQRFWTLRDLHEATLAHRNAARIATINTSDLRVEAISDEVKLIGNANQAALTHWAFSQLSARAGAPAGYLRELPATLAAQNINYGLKHNAGGNDVAKVLLHSNGGYYARAITTPTYTRVWNHQVVERLLHLEDEGWRTPPAYPVEPGDYHIVGGGTTPNTRMATAEDAAHSLTIKEGDIIGPSGLYASFEDMFVFLVNNDSVLNDGSAEGLKRGFFVWNSEVGKSSFGIMKFLHRGVCGNHIVWGASAVAEIKVRHVGNADDRAFAGVEVELKKYAEESASEDEQRIAKARTYRLGTSMDKVIDYVFSHGFFSRKVATEAYTAVLPDVDGDPNTAWGYAQGVTRLSQLEGNADKRLALDRTAGKILEEAF